MFRATIKNGAIYFLSVKASIAWEAWMADHDGAKISITEEKPSRSQSQNAYYWMYLGIIEKETGQNADDIHEWAKRKFLPPRFITVNGEEMRIPGSTRALDKAAFSEYLDKIAAEIGIALPNPEDAGYITNYDPLKKL